MKRVTLGFVMALVAAVFIAGPALAGDHELTHDKDKYPPQPEETETPEVEVSPSEVVSPEEVAPRARARAEAEELAVTGFDVTTGMLAGIGLLGAGGLALAAARHKSRNSE
jgi:hypothetical protein